MASSMEIWKEARRRCTNHLRLALVEQRVKSKDVAKMNLTKQVDELMSADEGEYIRVAFVRLNVKVDHDDE